MPYLDIPNYEGIPIPRVTEILGSEFSQWLDKNHPKRWQREKRIDFTTVRGTLFHNKIEDYFNKTENMPVRERKSMDRKILEIIKQDLDKPPTKRILEHQVNRCFVNFLKYWTFRKKEYNIRPLYIETRLYCEKYAGTCDLIAVITVNNKDYIALFDWKSAEEFQTKYQFQLSAYQHLAEIMVKSNNFVLPKLPFYYKHFIVLCGGLQPAEYIVEHNISGFFDYYNRYLNPIKDKCSEYGRSCYYCQDIIRCEIISSYKKGEIYKRAGYLPENPHLLK